MCLGTSSKSIRTASHEVSNVAAIYLLVLALLIGQAIVLETYVTTLAVVVSTILFVILGYSQPKLQWESVYLPMAKNYATKELGLEKMQDMIIAITGSTSGIGMELTRLFAKQGIRVIAIGRSKSKLKALQEEYPKAIETVLCDLTDLESVAKAADEMNKKYPRLDVLVNNAGIQLGMQHLWKGHATSKQGYDMVFGVNYLSHFLLTEKLIPLLQKSTKPKILQISSSYHWTVDGSDLQPTPKASDGSSSGAPPVAAQVGGSHGFVLYRGIRQYANSKLAQILHARALQRRYTNNNNKNATNIRVVSACPAWVGTQIAGKEGSLVHSGFVQLAYPVNGHGINSFLNAIFHDSQSMDDDFYVNVSVTKPNILDQMPLWMSRVLPIRDIVGNMIAFTLLPFQRMAFVVKQTSPSSRASYNEDLQESLYEWSKNAVSEYL